MKAYLEIEMPRCCNKCPMLVYEGHTLCICRALPAIEDGEILKPWKNKRKDCPLKPIQPHGRLIDADAYEKLLRGLGNRDYRREAGTLQDAIKFLHPHYAPTIIPAEEGK